MGEVLELAERAWSGALEGSPVQPGAATGFEVLRPGLAFLAAFFASGAPLPGFTHLATLPGAARLEQPPAQIYRLEDPLAETDGS